MGSGRTKNPHLVFIKSKDITIKKLGKVNKLYRCFLAVREFVFVRWPRTGSLFTCRKPL